MKFQLTEDQKLLMNPLLDRYYYEADMYFTRIRDQAARNYQYYHGELPVLAHDSVIPLTSRICKQQVLGALKDLVEVFLSNDHEPIQFVPEAEDDTGAFATAATKLVRSAYNENNGDMLITSVLLESLINGTAFIKRHYETKREVITTEAKNLKDENEAQGMILAWREGGLKIDDADIELTQNEDGTYDLVATYEGEFEGFKMYHMPLEEILFDQKAGSINGVDDGCTYFCHRVRKTKSELLDLGFTKEEVETFNQWTTETMADDYFNVNASRSDFVRYDDQDIGSPTDDNATTIWVREEYVRTNLLEPNKTPTLYKFYKCNNILLSEAEIVSEIPVSAFTPDILPHQIMGDSLCKFVSDIQDKISWIERDALKHSQMTANPRWIVQTEAVDQRSLLMNAPNSVIEVDAMGTIERLEPPPMDQGINLLLQIAMDEAENRTGINSTQQGNVTNMLESGRQAEASVDKMLQLASGKVRMFARNLANGGFKDLFLAAYRLIREHATQPVQVLTAGGVININPSQLPDRRHIRINVALTSQEKAKRAAALLQLAQFKQMVDPQGQFSQPQNVAYMLYEMTEALGFPNFHDFNLPIEAYQQPQPGPMDQIAMAKAQAEIEHTQAQAKKLVQDAHNSTEKQVIEAQIAADETKRKDMELTFAMQKAADDTHLNSARLQRDVRQDNLRYQQHVEKHETEQFRANTDNLKVQSNIMLESRKQSYEGIRNAVQ